jgi:peptidoglycan/xylan/chitin deacetylase (PgdA/CDA1 family)
LILCYHGVSLDDEHECSDLYVSAAHLKRRLQLLRDAKYNVIPLHIALELQRTGELPDKAVTITFDDGAYDFIVQAYPLLKSFSLHATLYLTTYYCSRQTPVFDTMLAYLLWKGSGRHVELSMLNFGKRFLIPIAGDARSAVHLRLRSEASANLDEEQKQESLAELASRLNVDFTCLLNRRLLQIMNAEEVKSLDQTVVDIQLHTHRHRMPTDETQFKQEIDDNRRAIEAILGDTGWRGEHFCYPSGEYHAKVFPWLEQLEVKSATTCHPGLVSQSTPSLLLPRFVDTMNISESAFIAWLSGAGAWVPRKRSPRDKLDAHWPR